VVQVPSLTPMRAVSSGSADFLVRVSGVLPGLWWSFLGDFVMPSDQISFTDVEYVNRRRVPFVSSFWTRWVTRFRGRGGSG